MRLYILCTFLCISISSIAASKFSLCAYIDDSDKAIGFYETFATENTGNDIYIYYNSDKGLDPSYKVKIERMENRVDSSYALLDEITLKPKDPASTYAYQSYEFSLPGFYKFTLLDNSGTNTVETYKTSIRYLDNYYAADSTLDTWYYKNVKMVFCDSVLSEIFIGKKNKFTYNPNGTVISTYVSHDDEKKLRTEKIIAKIYSTNDSKQLVNTVTIDLQPTQRFTIFPITLKDKGKYSVELFSDKDIFIQKKAVEIE